MTIAEAWAQFKNLLTLDEGRAKAATCRKCGAIVTAGNMELHINWHKGLIEDLPVPEGDPCLVYPTTTPAPTPVLSAASTDTSLTADVPPTWTS